MFLISDKVVGIAAVIVAAIILVIVIICAIISACSKKKSAPDQIKVYNAPVVDEQVESEDEDSSVVVEDEESSSTEEESVEEGSEDGEEEIEKEEAIPAEEETVEETEEVDDVEEDDTKEESVEEEKAQESDSEEETEEESEEETEEESEDEEDEESKEEETPVDEKSEEAPVKRTGRYAGKYIIRCENDAYRYQLLASNGQSLIISEPYTTERGCRNGINTVKKNAVEGTIKIDADKHGLYFFTLVSKQNRILCQSANYSTKDAAEKASVSFKKFALTDNIIFDENATGSVSTSEKADVEFEEKENGTYEIEVDGDKGFIYVLKASNNVKLVTSQDYGSLASCKEALERFREAVYSGEFLIYKDKNNNFQFKLYNNKRLVVAGEVYSSRAQVIQTIISIKSYAKKAQYVEREEVEDEE